MKQIKFSGTNGQNKAALVTLAVNGAFTIDGADVVCPISTEATGSEYNLDTTISADSQPIQQFTPRYISQARRGVNAAVVVKTSGTSHSLADFLGEFETYSYVNDGTYSFIWGTLNFDQIDDGFTSIILEPTTGTDVNQYVFWA